MINNEVSVYDQYRNKLMCQITLGLFILFTLDYLFVERNILFAKANSISAFLLIIQILIITYSKNLLFIKKNGLVFIVYLNFILSHCIVIKFYNIPSYYWFSIIPALAILVNNYKNAIRWGNITIITVLILGFLLKQGYLKSNLNQDVNAYLFHDQIGFFFTILILLYFIYKIYLKAYSNFVDASNQLIESKNKEIESQKYKDLFFANISHELRTPLNSIIGISTLIKNKPDSAEKNEYIGTIEYASNHLLSVINDILDISKLNANQFNLVYEPINIKNLVAKIYNMLSVEKNSQNIDFTIQFSPDFPIYASVDEIRLSQILINIIKNALKFTENGFVKIECNLINNQNLCFTISDSGIGIDEKYIDKIFSNYTQENAKISNKYGGTGLGLSISYKLVLLMKGNITCTSHKDNGSVFKISIPYLPCEPVLDENISNKKLNDFVSELLKNKSILLVDDNKFNLLITRKIIEQTFPDTKIYSVENGIETLAFLKDNKVDIILMDLQMPHLDGIETTKIIRKTDKDIVIITLTAMNADTSTIHDCLMVGMNDFISKPFDMDKFIQVINSLYNK